MALPELLPKSELLAHASIGLEADLATIATELLSRGWMLTAAESCSGGLIAAACTDIAGSSQWFERGVISYSNASKTELLGVPKELLASQGAVSEPVVRAMAAGALVHSHAQVSLAVTGIAGPGGGSADKPVGTVWFGWCVDEQIRSEVVQFSGDRAAVRHATVRHALSKLATWLTQQAPVPLHHRSASAAPEQSQADALQRLLAQNQALQMQLEGLVQTLNKKEKLYRQLTDDMQDVLWQTDANLHITYISPADERLRGYKAEEVIGTHVFEMLTDEGITVVQQKMLARSKVHTTNAQKDGFSSFEVEHRCKDGRVIWGEIQAKEDRNSQGALMGYHGITRETTERKRLQDQVHNLAFCDTLTQLANRRLLIEHLKKALRACQRHREYGGLLFLDLDNFKTLNDTHGHGAGDLLLIEVGQRLKAGVRNHIDTVARFGGDEFVVLLSTLSPDQAKAHAQAATIAEKVRALLAEPYLITVTSEDQPPTTVEHRGSASIGAVLFNQNDSESHAIIDKADAAMYRAKAAGRNRVCFDGQSCPSCEPVAGAARPRS